MDKQRMKELQDAVDAARKAEHEAFAGSRVHWGQQPELDCAYAAMTAAQDAAGKAFYEATHEADDVATGIHNKAEAAKQAVLDQHAASLAQAKTVIATGRKVRDEACAAAKAAFDKAVRDLQIDKLVKCEAVRKARLDAERALVLTVIGGPYRPEKPWVWGAKRRVSRMLFTGSANGKTVAVGEVRLTLHAARRPRNEPHGEPPEATLSITTFVRDGAPGITLSTGWIAGDTLADAVSQAEKMAEEAGWYARAGSAGARESEGGK